jgi:hypothetical protein
MALEFSESSSASFMMEFADCAEFVRKFSCKWDIDGLSVNIRIAGVTDILF